MMFKRCSSTRRHYGDDHGLMGIINSYEDHCPFGSMIQLNKYGNFQ